MEIDYMIIAQPHSKASSSKTHLKAKLYKLYDYDTILYI